MERNKENKNVSCVVHYFVLLSMFVWMYDILQSFIDAHTSRSSCTVYLPSTIYYQSIVTQYNTIQNTDQAIVSSRNLTISIDKTWWNEEVGFARWDGMGYAKKLIESLIRTRLINKYIGLSERVGDWETRETRETRYRSSWNITCLGKEVRNCTYE